MMTARVDSLFLFGFSRHFVRITEFLDDSDIECFVVFAPRQRASIESLDLSSSVQKLCVCNLNETCFQDIGVRNRISLGMSFGAAFIFTQKDIDDFDGRLINSHGAPLPDFKGGGGFSWRILQRDKRGSILMHYVTTMIDEGTCVFRKNFIFSDEERLPMDLQERQFKEESEYLLPWIKKIIFGDLMLENLGDNGEPDVEPGTYFPRLASDLHGCINWTLSIQDLESFVLAFSHPYPGAFTLIKGHKVRIMDLSVERQCNMHPFTYGLVLYVGLESLHVACNGGIISIRHDSLCIENEQRDIRVNCGDRFWTQESLLQHAFLSRAFYKPDGLIVRDYTS